MSHEHTREHVRDDNDDEHKAQHNINMLKGLVAMMGLVLFFFTEKALTLLAEWRKLRQRRNKVNVTFQVEGRSDRERRVNL